MAERSFHVKQREEFVAVDLAMTAGTSAAVSRETA
jgi:hypothetical protein